MNAILDNIKLHKVSVVYESPRGRVEVQRISTEEDLFNWLSHSAANQIGLNNMGDKE